MYLDEKIALMEREQRQKEKETRAAAEEKNAAASVKKLTLQEALEGIRAGEMRLQEGEHLEFETRVYTGQEVPMIIFKNFHQASKEDKEGVIYINHAKEVSQILSWPKTQIKPVTFNQWSNQLVNGMASNGLHARVGKKKQLDYIEYICFDVPTGKGWLYNIVFRKKGKEQSLTGNYNCLKEDKDTYGIFLEAMVVAMDQWFAQGEGGGLFGEQSREEQGE